ncbi:MAG: hypothetical protein HQL44_05550 [Alphaproteobacteria bacterium]|nr:hypothetical protein [Alphaproteobacteria bacterium]
MRAAWLRARTAPLLTGLAALPLMAFAFYHSLRYGLRGFNNAADIVFYGGWQVANGNLPYIDFFVSYGAVQYLIQGGLMHLFGPSWLVYCAHAAAFNAAYALLVLLLLKRFGLSLWMAFIYAWCAAIVYYPVMGYPQPDKHSFLFLILGLVLQLTAAKDSSQRKTAALYAGAALSYVAAFFCKANPTLLYPLVGAAALLGLSGKRQWLAALGGGFAALGAVLLSGLLIEAVYPGFMDNLVFYMITLPGEIAKERSGGSWPILKLGDYARFPSFTLSYAILAAGLTLLALRLRHVIDETFRQTVLLPLLLAFCFVLITVFHVTHIGQPPSAHVVLIVPAIALAHAALLKGLNDGAAVDLARLVCSVLILAFVAMDVSEYNRTVVKRRVSYDLDFDISAMQARGASGLPELAHVEYVPLTANSTYLEAFADVQSELKALNGNVMLLGLSPWHYAFAKKQPVLPAIYVIPGHSSPREDSAKEAQLAERLARNMESADVKTLIMRPELSDNVLRLLDGDRMVCGVEVKKHLARVDLCQPFKATSTKAALNLLRLAS